MSQISSSFLGSLPTYFSWLDSNVKLTRVGSHRYNFGESLETLRAVYTVIHFLWISAKFGTCTVVRANGTQVEDKMRRFKGECAQFSFNQCPIYTHDGASAKFSTNSQEMDNSVVSSHSRGFLSRLKIFKSMGPSLWTSLEHKTPSYDTKMNLKVIFDKNSVCKILD